MYEEHVKNITQVIPGCFDRVYQENLNQPQQCLIPEAKRYGDATEEECVTTPEEFSVGLKNSKNTTELQEKFWMEILRKEVINNVAMVRAHLKILAHNCYDFLLLSLANAEWKIVNKVFDHVE